MLAVFEPHRLTERMSAQQGTFCGPVMLTECEGADRRQAFMGRVASDAAATYAGAPIGCRRTKLPRASPRASGSCSGNM